MNNLIQSFGPALILAGILFVFVVLPLWGLKRFAVKEQKDWRVVLLVGFFFSFVIGLVLVFVLPRLSDEEHARINKPSEHKSFQATGMKLPKPNFSDMGADEWFKPAMWFLGIGSAFALGLMAWMQWLM